MVVRETVKDAHNIVIRCDGGSVVGMGHVVRCLALARALSECGAGVTFATWSDPGAAGDRIRACGYPNEHVGARAPRHTPLEADDLRATVACARSRAAAVVLVDHYQADAAYLTGLAEAGLRVAVIDDVADRDLRSADWVLNQNLGAQGLRYRVRDDCTVLRGLEYALLRGEFAETRARLHREFHSDDRRVLMTLGGSDVVERLAALVAALRAPNITGRVARFCPRAGARGSDLSDALRTVNRHLEVRCVLAGADSGSALTRATATSGHDVLVLTDVADMAEQMAWADVSINAGGSTCWELCCLGLPMVVMELSADQARNVAMLGECEIAASVGKWDQRATPAVVAGAVEDLLGDAPRRAGMSARAMERVDGGGAARAADSLCALLREHEGALR